MASSTTPIPSDPTMMAAARYQKEALEPLAKAQALQIRTADDYQAAGELKVACRKLRQGIALWFRGTPAQPGMIPKAHASHQELCTKEAGALKPLKDADDLLERKMLAWKAADKKRQAAEQQAAEAAAQRVAEDERLAQAVALANEAEAKGDAALMRAAEELVELPLDVAPVYVGSSVPKVAGVVSKKEPHVEVTDMRALVLAVAAGVMKEEARARLASYTVQEHVAIVGFLSKFEPTSYAALEGVRYDKAGRIDGLGVLDVHMKWLRDEYGRRRESFKLAGVLAEDRDAIV